jgi:uncharacterized membrane protein
MDQHPGRVLLFLTAIYTVMAVSLASIRLLWFDEFITFYIAKLNSVHGIWQALARGADPNPPLTHLLVMWCMRLFGDGRISLRLPALIAGWFGFASVYWFLKPRVGATYAAVGMSFAMATFALSYSCESRSYALMLAFAMFSLVVWREAVEGRHRLWASVVLAIVLAAGLSSNYYAVLAFFPIAAGELVRLSETRRIELRVWAALLAGGLPIFVYMPLINGAVARFAPHAWNRTRMGTVTDSYELLIEVILWPALALLAAGTISCILQRRRGKKTDPVLPHHELAAVLMQMAYPFLGYVIAVARAGMLSPRFLLPICYGFAIAVAVTGRRLFARKAVATLALLIVCLSWAVARAGWSGWDFITQKYALYRVRDNLPAGKTLAVTDALLATPLYYYSSPAVRSRIVVPLDFDAIHQYKGEDSPEQNLWAGRGFVWPMPVVTLADLETSTADYLIVTTRDNWLLQLLKAEGTPARRLPIDTHSKDITGAMPLCHGEPFVFERTEALARSASNHQFHPATATSSVSASGK